MTRLAEQLAALPLGGLLLTWSTFTAIREGRARRLAERMGGGAIVAMRGGRIVVIGELAARSEPRQHHESEKERPAAEGIGAGPVDTIAT